MVHSPHHRHRRSVALLGLVLASGFGITSARLHRQRDGSAESPATAADRSLSIEDDESPPQLPSDSESLIAMQFSDDPYAHRDKIEMIENGELGLAAIRFVPTSFAAGGDEYYNEVYADLCVFDANLNTNDPANYPTINDVMAKSNHCSEHSYSMPLREAIQAVNDHDNSRKSNMKRLPVSGLLFHEGYSGAGLISNALATFDSTLVIAEHPAIRDALSACDAIRNRFKSEDCSPSKQRQLVRDVISLLSRTSDTSNIERLYLKLSSASGAYLQELRSLYPDAKWAFVYRNAGHALAKATQRKRSSTCVKTRRNPSTALSAKSNEFNVDLETLSHHEVCALHLSTLLDAAFKEHDKSGTGILVSYDDVILQNVDAIVDSILPYLGLQEDIEADPQGVRNRVSEIVWMRSNASSRVNPEDKKWGGEEIEVTEEVGAASKAFMSDSMNFISA